VKAGTDPSPSIGPRGSIIENIGVLTVAQAATMLLNVVALAHIARTVGNYWFGVVQLGVAFSSYVLIAAEWGMYTLGVREVSRLDRLAEVREYTGVHLGLMSVMGLVAMALAATLLPLFRFYAHDPAIFLIYLATTVPMFLSLDWVGLGLERMNWVSATKILRSLIYAGGVLLLLNYLDGRGGWPAPRWVPVIFLTAYFAATAVIWVVVARWLGGAVRPHWGPLPEWGRRLRTAGPIGAANITLRVLLNVDVLLLGLLVTPAQVGNYAAAAKIIFVLVVAVEVIWRALLPRLARLWQDDPARFRQRYNLYLGLVLLGFVPLAVGGVLLGGRLMDLIYGGDYPGAEPVARILSASYVLLAVGQFFGNALLASDRQRAYFPPLAVSAAVAVAAVWLLTGRAEIVGAATGMLVAHLTLLVATGWACRDLLSRSLLSPLLASAAGAAVMGGTVTWLAGSSLLILVPVGAAVHTAVALPLARSWWRRERGR
jgi:O-antigen/teichoic acid export membrane protein